jgi:hypothetical protein
VIAALKGAPTVTFKAKDILRAAGLALLPVDDPHVASDLKRSRQTRRCRRSWSYAGTLGTGVALQVADGYHRVCASYHTDENTNIVCRLATPAAALT